MDMICGKLYEAGEIDPRWLQQWFYQFPIPTEMVVEESRIVTPRMSRVYPITAQTPLTADEKYQSWQWFLCEVWENQGADGHVQYMLEGWILWGKDRLVTGEDLHCAEEERRPYSPDGSVIGMHEEKWWKMEVKGVGERSGPVAIATIRGTAT